MDNKVSFEVELKTDDKGVIHATASMHNLENAIRDVKNGTSSYVENIGKVSIAMDALSNMVGKLNAAIKSLTSSYAAQETAEAKLAQVMRNTMGASDAEFQSIKDLTSAQQQLGVIGDEVQLAGAQELGTYLEKTETLKKLIPVMNDMVAQQYGLEASQESAVGIATMLGKVMEGQVGALSRYGYSFDEVEEKILKFGTEEERATVLAKVVTESVGGMNEALAQTDSGKMAQLSNYLGDIKEQMGAVAASFAPMLDYITMAGDMATSIGSITQAFTMAVPAVKAFGTALISNPIGIVVAAVAALGAALYALYENCDEFRNGVDNLFSSLSDLIGGIIDAASELYDSLKPAIDIVWAAFKKLMSLWLQLVGSYLSNLIKGLKWLATTLGGAIKTKIQNVVRMFQAMNAAVRSAWDWIKKLLGIEDDLADTTDDNTQSLDDNIEAINKEADAYDKLYKKAQNGGYGEDNTVTSKVKTETVAPDGSLKALQTRLQTLQAQIDLEIDPAKRAALYKELDALKKQKITIEAKMKLDASGYEGQMERLESKTDGLAASLGEADLGKPVLNGMKTMKKGIKAQEDYEAAERKRVEAQKDGYEITQLTAQGFDQMGDAIGGAAGDMMSWAANQVAAIAQVIPQIVALMTAKQGEAMAESTASGAALPFPANIAAIAAGIATVVAAFAKMPKFADGGIISGPTIGLMGEYSGASNNPEVVAPLNRLKSLIGDGGTGGGRVEFDIKGRKLVGVLARENSIMRRQ